MAGICPEYKVNIPKDSPAYKLYDELGKPPYSISNVMFDRHGYHEVTYKEPGKQPELEGADDCVVVSKEVEELALDDWRKFRIPLERFYGERLSWAIDDVGSFFPYKPETKVWKKEYFEQVKKLEELVDRKLAIKGLKKGSDEYRKGKGLAFLWFSKVPKQKNLSSWPQTQKDKLKAEIKQSLAPLGLEDVADYLSETGGTGWYSIFNLNYLPSSFSFYSSPSSVNTTLYGLFDYLGLNPQFIDTYLLPNDEQYKCGIALVHDYIVGLKLNDDFMLFDGVFSNPSISRTYFYPVNLRHVVEADAGKDQFMDILMKKEGARDSGELSFESLLLKLSLLGKKYQKAETMPKEFIDEIVKLWEQSASNPYLKLIIAMILHKKRPDLRESLLSHPLLPIRGKAYHLVMEFYDGDDYEKEAQYARKLIEIDADCAPAYETLARDYYKLGKYDLAEQYFLKAEELVSTDEYHLKSFYRNWGYSKLESGKFEEAFFKFRLFLKVIEALTEKDVADEVVRCHFFIGITLEKLGRKEEAAKAFDKSFKLLRSYLKTADLKKTDELVKSLREAREKFKPSLPNISQIFTFIGQVYLYNGKLDEAGKAFDEASEFDKTYPTLTILQRQLKMKRK